MYMSVFWWDLALATSLVLLRDVESEENIDYMNTISGQPSKVTPCNVDEFFKLWTLEIPQKCHLLPAKSEPRTRSTCSCPPLTAQLAAFVIQGLIILSHSHTCQGHRRLIELEEITGVWFP